MHCSMYVPIYLSICLIPQTALGCRGSGGPDKAHCERPGPYLINFCAYVQYLVRVTFIWPTQKTRSHQIIQKKNTMVLEPFPSKPTSGPPVAPPAPRSLPDASQMPPEPLIYKACFWAKKEAPAARQWERKSLYF